MPAMPTRATVPCEHGSYQLSLTETTFAPGPHPGTRHGPDAYYVVAVTSPSGSSWVVAKRYEEFAELREKMLLARLQFPGEFPSQRHWGRGNKQKYVDERAAMFGRLLRSALLPNIRHPLVARFLRLEARERVSAPPAASQPAEVGWGHPLYTHKHGVAATLSQLDKTGAAGRFGPLAAQWQAVLRESGSSEFQTIVDKPELLVEAQQSGKELAAIRATDRVAGARPEELFHLTNDVPVRASWEAKYKFSKKVAERLTQLDGPDDEVFLFKFPGMMMVKGREFVDRRITFRDPAAKLYVVLSGATTEPNPPEDKKFIRGETLYQVNLVFGTPDGAAHYMLALADPKAPPAVNSQSKSQPAKWHKALKQAFAAYRAEHPVQSTRGRAASLEQDIARVAEEAAGEIDVARALQTGDLPGLEQVAARAPQRLDEALAAASREELARAVKALIAAPRKSLSPRSIPRTSGGSPGESM